MDVIVSLVNYNFPSGWYLTSTPTIVADWEADNDNRWTVPVGRGVGQRVLDADIQSRT